MPHAGQNTRVSYRFRAAMLIIWRLGRRGANGTFRRLGFKLTHNRTPRSIAEPGHGVVGAESLGNRMAGSSRPTVWKHVDSPNSSHTQCARSTKRQRANASRHDFGPAFTFLASAWRCSLVSSSDFRWRPSVDHSRRPPCSEPDGPVEGFCNPMPSICTAAIREAPS